jgi:hypothetical protein
MIAVLIEVIARIQLHALEMVVHDEIHDACHGVRAMHGGRAACKHIDAPDRAPSSPRH